MEKDVFFGIDTSNYTTSFAVVTEDGEIFSEKRHLAVAPGERGTRQCDALFCHIRDIPEIAEKAIASARKAYPDMKVKAVGASVSPRRAENSYMPCFLAGKGVGKTLAVSLGVPFFEFSHQEGHIRSAIAGCVENGKPFPECDEFFALHLSGGTGELLFVRKNGGRYDTVIISRTLDITVGQFIDRCGVKMGMNFPAGAEMDKIASEKDADIKVKIPKKENGINLSGFENKFDKMLSENAGKETLSTFAFSVALEAVKALLSFIPEDKKSLPVLFSGGVASSSFMKKHLAGEGRFFAPAKYSADNAIGTAFLTMDGGKND